MTEDLMISNKVSPLQYPAACANAAVLLAVVLMVAAIVHVVDVRKKLWCRGATDGWLFVSSPPARVVEQLEVRRGQTLGVEWP